MNTKMSSALNLQEREALLANLAWECAERISKGEKVSLDEYLTKLPDDEARQEFKILIGMSALADAALRRDRRH